MLWRVLLTCGPSQAATEPLCEYQTVDDVVEALESSRDLLMLYPSKADSVKSFSQAMAEWRAKTVGAADAKLTTIDRQLETCMREPMPSQVLAQLKLLQLMIQWVDEPESDQTARIQDVLALDINVDFESRIAAALKIRPTINKFSQVRREIEERKARASAIWATYSIAVGLKNVTVYVDGVRKRSGQSDRLLPGLHLVQFVGPSGMRESRWIRLYEGENSPLKPQTDLYPAHYGGAVAMDLLLLPAEALSLAAVDLGLRGSVHYSSGQSELAAFVSVSPSVTQVALGMGAEVVATRKEAGLEAFPLSVLLRAGGGYRHRIALADHQVLGLGAQLGFLTVPGTLARAPVSSRARGSMDGVGAASSGAWRNPVSSDDLEEAVATNYERIFLIQSAGGFGHATVCWRYEGEHGWGVTAEVELGWAMTGMQVPTGEEEPILVSSPLAGLMLAAQGRF